MPALRIFLFVGNSGVGKSYLLNRMLDEDRFESGPNLGGLTTQLEDAVITAEQGEPITLFNIPGLVEASEENIKRNQQVLQEALSKDGEYKMIFVFSGAIGGRVQPKDVFAYHEFCKGYNLSNLPIVMNNLKLSPKPGEDKAELLHQYWAKLISMFKGLGINNTECQVIEQGAAREDILRKLHAASESFPWQKMPPAKPMNFNESDQATQAAMQKNELKIRALAKQVNDNKEQLRQMVANTRAQEERQRAAFDQQMAALQQSVSKVQNQLSYEESQRAASERHLSSIQSKISSIQSDLRYEQRRAEEARREQERAESCAREQRRELERVRSQPAPVIHRTEYRERRSSGSCIIS